MTIRVVIADDHTIIRQGLAHMLRAAEGIELVGEASDGDEAFEVISKKKPDVAVLDISMPKKSGIELAGDALVRRLGVKVILLTMHDESAIVDRALKAGAAGYLLKDDAFGMLRAAIEKVHEGKTYISPTVAAGLIEHRETSGKGPPPLSPRETEVAALIAGGFSNREVAGKLKISLKTVETHRSRIMAKLGIHKTADLVRYAMKEGLVLPEEGGGAKG